MIFSVEETIDAPRETVWRYMTDPATMPDWMAGIENMRLADGQSMGEGAELLFAARGADRRSTVATFAPPETLVLRSVQGPVTATYRYTLTADGAVTRASLQANCAAKGWMRLVMPLLRSMIRRVDGGQLKALRDAMTARTA